MKQIVVLSGKGGTGKTTLTASFAALAKDCVLADCDVDAADLHLLLEPTILSKQEFKGSKMAVIDRSKCTECGKCVESCRFNAIENFTVNFIMCEGCAVCAYVCPEHAVKIVEKVSGYAYISKTRFGPMCHARLGVAEENSGRLVTLVRNNAKQMAEKEDKALILIDGPPGIGCPAIASVTGADLSVIVTEPTISGIHDLERILGVIRHFRVAALVCINMYDINKENTAAIAELCRKNSVELIGMIPYDPIVTKAMVDTKTIVEYSPYSTISNEIVEIWNKILTIQRML